VTRVFCTSPGSAEARIPCLSAEFLLPFFFRVARTGFHQPCSAQIFLPALWFFVRQVSAPGFSFQRPLEKARPPSSFAPASPVSST
jgi:hypothetical protein